MITVFYVGLFLCCFLCLYRIALGPTAPDRTVAIDILGIVIVGFCAFIGTIALAKFLEGRSFND
jgi:multicomponent Na+:H+ antiporter subunit F